MLGCSATTPPPPPRLPPSPPPWQEAKRPSAHPPIVLLCIKLFYVPAWIYCQSPLAGLQAGSISCVLLWEQRAVLVKRARPADVKVWEAADAFQKKKKKTRSNGRFQHNTLLNNKHRKHHHHEKGNQKKNMKENQSHFFFFKFSLSTVFYLQLRTFYRLEVIGCFILSTVNVGCGWTSGRFFISMRTT